MNDHLLQENRAIEEALIEQALPEVSQDFASYDKAMRLVEERQLKSDFVELTNWLLVENKRLRELVKDSPKYFSAHSFDGEKLNWLNKANDLKVFE